MWVLLLLFKGAQSRINGLKSLAKLFNLNPCQSSQSLTILAPLCFVITSLVFFYLCKVLFLGFLQFNSNFVHAKKNSKYRDWAPLNSLLTALFKALVLKKEWCYGSWSLLINIHAKIGTKEKRLDNQGTDNRGLTALINTEWGLYRLKDLKPVPVKTERSSLISC